LIQHNFVKSALVLKNRGAFSASKGQWVCRGALFPVQEWGGGGGNYQLKDSANNQQPTTNNQGQMTKNQGRITKDQGRMTKDQGRITNNQGQKTKDE